MRVRGVPAVGLGLGMLLAGAADAPRPALAPFTSDYCTVVRERDAGGADWSHCCVRHDLAYWAGGTADERAAADAAMRACRLAADKSEGNAKVMWLGVRSFGHPAWPVSWRWGYGWPYGRGYDPLTAEERVEVARRTAAFCADLKSPPDQVRAVCPARS